MGLRRLAGAATTALVLLPAGSAAAHPGHGGEAIVIDGDAFLYTPPAVKIGVGETLIWFWDGALFRNHSVTADPGQAEQFDSDPGGLPTNASHPDGSTFSHAFTHRGVFTYYCKVHPSMRGSVEVVPVPDAVAGAPRLRSLDVEAKGKRVRASFRLSERADVVGRIAGRDGGRWRTVDSFAQRARAGRNVIRVPTGELRRGSYRLTLVAYDSADRRSNEAQARFALGRRG
ncbi:MAG TPA: plastocyanin/azurin family copper-binding protein [Solirubrobacterales bacterium]|nr:plastocyanin/azurin family copper-binding protein [Solirubrobacterales bacterium]